MTLAGDIAVVGAGIAGLACARRLREAGAAVTVFERQAQPSGRAATLIEAAGPYDHGAQYFTVRDARFAAEVQRWRSEDVVQRWTGRIVAMDRRDVKDKTGSAERFVAVPGMRRLGVHLARGIDVRLSTPVLALQSAGERWRLLGEGGELGRFSTVLLAMPSGQAAALLDGLTRLAAVARTVDWQPCWAVTVALAHPSGADFEGAFINDDPILGWAALDSAKPRRGRVDGVAERWVLHAHPAWSARYAGLGEDEVSRWLARAFSARLRGKPMPQYARAVRWDHAMPVNPLAQPCLWDPAQRLGAAGDWCGGPRIEGAYLSGLALAEAALQ